MDWIYGFIGFMVFVLGATIGSFLNVCIYRIPNKESIVKPRSKCGSCGRTLSGKDLVPLLSWLFLRGKCRTCGAKISVRYPLVETLEGVLFLWVYLTYGFTVVTPVLWVFFALMTVVFFIDLDHMIIPNKVVLTGILLGLPLVFVHYYVGYPLYLNASIWAFVLGPVIPLATMILLAFASQVFFRAGSLGMGDVKVYVPIGIFLGWRLSLLSLWMAFFLGGLFGVVWIFFLKKDRKANVPFAPFITLGAVISAIYGMEILEFLF